MVASEMSGDTNRPMAGCDDDRLRSEGGGPRPRQCPEAVNERPPYRVDGRRMARDAGRGCTPRAGPLADQTLRLGRRGGRPVTSDPVCRRVVLDIRGRALRTGVGVGWCFDGVRPHRIEKLPHPRRGAARACVRPRRLTPSPRVPRSRAGPAVWLRREPQRTDGRCPAPAAPAPRPRAGPRALTRCRGARGGGPGRCAGRRGRPRGAADGLAPAAPDRRPAGPRRRAVPARG